jgi:hypothetical protein
MVWCFRLMHVTRNKQKGETGKRRKSRAGKDRRVAAAGRSDGSRLDVTSTRKHPFAQTTTVYLAITLVQWRPFIPFDAPTCTTVPALRVAQASLWYNSPPISVSSCTFHTPACSKTCRALLRSPCAQTAPQTRLVAPTTRFKSCTPSTDLRAAGWRRCAIASTTQVVRRGRHELTQGGGRLFVVDIDERLLYCSLSHV